MDEDWVGVDKTFFLFTTHLFCSALTPCHKGHVEIRQVGGYIRAMQCFSGREHLVWEDERQRVRCSSVTHRIERFLDVFPIRHTPDLRYAFGGRGAGHIQLSNLSLISEVVF